MHKSRFFHYNDNIMGDELLLNFGAKFRHQFVISHVKWKPSVHLSEKMAT